MLQFLILRKGKNQTPVHCSHTSHIGRTERDIFEQIVGGVKPTKPVKTAVAILHKDWPVCSGTLIGRYWLVTAAHCFTDVNLADMKVVAGENNLSSYFLSKSSKVKTAGIKDVHIARSYRRIKFLNDLGNKAVAELDNDLALVEMTEPLEENENIAHAALPPPGMRITGMELEVSGWGVQGIYKTQPRSLLTINILVKQEAECASTHGGTTLSPSRMFCGGSLDGTTCLGDSGGGALYFGYHTPALLGVVSFGEEYCDTSSVYTWVDTLLSWILSVTKIRYCIVMI